MTDTCPICIENISGFAVKRVQCPLCPFYACTTCTERFLVEATNDLPACMSCNKGWTIDFLHSSFTPRFMKLFWDAKAKLWLDREKGRMPGTVGLYEQLKKTKKELLDLTEPIEVCKKKREIYSKKYDKIKREIQDVRVTCKYTCDECSYLCCECRDYIEELGDQKNTTFRLRKQYKRKCRELLDKRSWMIEDRDRLAKGMEPHARDGEQKKKKEKKRFVMMCPVDDCRGFVSTAWKCGVCSTWACSNCRQVKGNKKDAPHTCEKDDVETAKLLAKDTKPCPKCAIPIFKIDGCDQMWCLECHTAFSWKTGKIETGVVHNPHFYQWQRTQNNGVAPRVPGDRRDPNAGCREPETYMYDGVFCDKELRTQYDKMTDMIRFRHHLTNVLNVGEFKTEKGELPNNGDLRIRYLAGEISEKTLKMNLKRRLRLYHRYKAYRDILIMFNTVSKDILLRGQCRSRANIAPFICAVEELEKLITYVCSELKNVSLHYNTQIYKICYRVYNNYGDYEWMLVNERGRVVV